MKVGTKRDDEEIHGKEIIFHCKRDKLNKALKF
jgi:hypothetical protein